MHPRSLDQTNISFRWSASRDLLQVLSSWPSLAPEDPSAAHVLRSARGRRPLVASDNPVRLVLFSYAPYAFISLSIIGWFTVARALLRFAPFVMEEGES